MSERTPIILLDVRSDLTTPIAATLIDGVTEVEARSTDEIWRPALEKFLNHAAELNVPVNEWPEHSQWTWESKVRDSTASSRFYGIECEEQMQGLLALREGELSRIVTSARLPIVYIDYLSTAPWNYEMFLSRIGERSRFRGCGTILMAVAVTLSQELGYNGRVGLHSLVEAEGFYSHVCRMTNMGIDMGRGGFRYFEMTPGQANDFMQRSKT